MRRLLGAVVSRKVPAIVVTKAARNLDVEKVLRQLRTFASMATEASNEADVKALSQGRAEGGAIEVIRRELGS